MNRYMEKLTEKQSKMVIEYFAQQAAAEVPVWEYWQEWDNYIWRSQFTTSLAIDRRIRPDAWEQLVEAQIELDKFDRNPEQWMDENNVVGAQHKIKEKLVDEVSWRIDTVFRNSGA